MSEEKNTPDAGQESANDKEQIRVIVIGSKKGVNNIIHTLYRLRFAEISEWSPLVRANNPGQMMSILTRTISTDA